MLLAFNDAGLRIGETHPRARISDDDVVMIRALYQKGLKYRDIAEKFDISNVDSRQALPV